MTTAEVAAGVFGGGPSSVVCFHSSRCYDLNVPPFLLRMLGIVCPPHPAFMSSSSDFLRYLIPQWCELFIRNILQLSYDSHTTPLHARLFDSRRHFTSAMLQYQPPPWQPQSSIRTDFPLVYKCCPPLVFPCRGNASAIAPHWPRKLPCGHSIRDSHIDDGTAYGSIVMHCPV